MRTQFTFPGRPKKQIDIVTRPHINCSQFISLFAGADVAIILYILLGGTACTMKKNAVVAIVSITLCALLGIAAYQTVHIVGGWISNAVFGCSSEADTDCRKPRRAETPID